MHSQGRNPMSLQGPPLAGHPSTSGTPNANSCAKAGRKGNKQSPKCSEDWGGAFDDFSGWLAGSNWAKLKVHKSRGHEWSPGWLYKLILDSQRSGWLLINHLITSPGMIRIKQEVEKPPPQQNLQHKTFTVDLTPSRFCRWEVPTSPIKISPNPTSKTPPQVVLERRCNFSGRKVINCYQPTTFQG